MISKRRGRQDVSSHRSEFLDVVGNLAVALGLGRKDVHPRNKELLESIPKGCLEFFAEVLRWVANERRGSLLRRETLSRVREAIEMNGLSFPVSLELPVGNVRGGKEMVLADTIPAEDRRELIEREIFSAHVRRIVSPVLDPKDARLSSQERDLLVRMLKGEDVEMAFSDGFRMSNRSGNPLNLMQMKSAASGLFRKLRNMFPELGEMWRELD